MSTGIKNITTSGPHDCNCCNHKNADSDIYKKGLNSTSQISWFQHVRSEVHVVQYELIYMYIKQVAAENKVKQTSKTK